jgi:hypothetical protein
MARVSEGCRCAADAREQPAGQAAEVEAMASEVDGTLVAAFVRQ